MRTKFRYTSRAPEQAQRRMCQSGVGAFDSYLKQLPMWKIRDGQNRIRFLPPTWTQADHYGYDIWVHYAIGANENAYLCAERMGRGPCVICAERAKLERAGQADAAAAMLPSRRVLVWVVDREDENAGPMLWPMPWTLDKSILQCSIDEDSGAILAIDHPDNGYDVGFTKEGVGIKTKYTGVRIARRATPLHQDAQTMDAWLNFVVENPLPECIIFYPEERIRAALGGTSAVVSTTSDKPTPSHQRSDDVDDDVFSAPTAKARTAPLRNRVREALGDDTNIPF